MKPLELQTFPTNGKEVFLFLKRRRWKLKGSNESHYDSYYFHEPGMKATKEFGVFFKKLVEGKVISIGNVAYVLGMSAKKLRRWYQEVLSGFTQALQSGEIGEDNLEVNEEGESVEIAVPILEKNNLGVRMGIDEKTINGTCYMILSNRETNKIARMAATLKTKYLMGLVKKFDIEKRMAVKSLSRDMASNYDWLGKQAFMNVYHIIISCDKTHYGSVTIHTDQIPARRTHQTQNSF